LEIVCVAGTVISLAITLDRSSSAAAVAESADSPRNIINPPAVDGDCSHGDSNGEGSSTTATITTAEPTRAEPSVELVMGRKKIQIAQIADERNRQVNHCN